MNNELPGYEFAKEKGYSLSFHSGDKKSATYTKNGLSLTCWDNNTAKLQGFYKIVCLSVDKFSYPNINFETFERQILYCLPQESSQ
jgi:hypothetical protein